MSVEGQGSFELIATDGDSFVKPDEHFWRSQAGSSMFSGVMSSSILPG